MDLADLSRILIAFAAVVGLIGVSALIARKAGLASQAAKFSRRRRLSLVETLPLDARRRAAIIRCDGREHLIILGATSETLIEADIPSCPESEEEAEAPPAFADAIARLNSLAGARNPFKRQGKADAA